MRAKSMALILVALACGLVATIGVSQVMKENSQTESVPSGPIVITLANVDIGAPITPETVKVEQWPQDRIPPGAIPTIEELEGKYAGQYMFPGEPILAGKLMDSNVDNSTKIPPGFRVAAVKVSEESAVANLIKPGDRVDVIAYIKSRGSGDSQQAKTFLRNIRIFAVNAQTARAKEVQGEDSHIDAKTVSLLVKPEQVQKILLAEQLGKIELSLRHPDDQTDDNSANESTSIDDLLGNNESKGGGLGGVGSLLSLIPRSAPELPELNKDEPFQMEILTPDQVVTWKWEDESKLPELVGERSNGTAASLPSGGSPVGPAIPTELPPGMVPSPVPPQPTSPFVGEA